MAHLSIDSSYPHVLKAVGADVVVLNNNIANLQRQVLRDSLFSSSCPLGDLKGKVDFIVCFVVGQGGGDYDSGSIEHNLSPRPLRGIIQLHNLSYLDNFNIVELGVIVGGGVAHEIGHYWHVPGNARIKIDNWEIETPTTEDIYNALNQGVPMPDYPIIARQDSHWSPYIAGDDSPMDAVNHSVYDDHWANNKSSTKCIRTTGPVYPVPGIGDVYTKWCFSPLERYIMGDLTEIPDAGNLVAHVLKPDWSYPLDFHSGLYIEFEDGQRWYHGFYRGPHQIAAKRTDGVQTSSTITIPAPGENLNLSERIGLRIIQVGKQTKFQVRIYQPSYGTGCRYFWKKNSKSSVPLQGIVQGPNLPGFNRISPEIMMMDMAAGQPEETTNPRAGWMTIQTVSGRVIKMGISTRTLDSASVHVLTSVDLAIWEQGSVMPGNTFSVPVFNLQQDIPKPGPRLLGNGSLMMPYAIVGLQSCIYDETDQANDAPKLFMTPPPADFAFGGIVMVERCAMVSWAGGSAIGKHLVGDHQTFRYSDFVLPWSGDDRVKRQAMPLDGKYKTLFCIAAQDTADITGTRIGNVDKIRKAWEVYFPLVVKHRQMDTIVP